MMLRYLSDPILLEGLVRFFPPFYHLFPQHVTNHPTNFHKVLPTIFDIYKKKNASTYESFNVRKYTKCFFFFLFSKKKVETIYKSINCKIANFCL